MKITVCIGSSCHIKGARQVVEGFNRLISEYNLKDKIALGGTFCLGKCGAHVSVQIDDVFHSVAPEKVEEFFKAEVLPKV